MIPKVYCRFALLCIGWLTTNSHALPDDPDQPIKIEADQMILDNEANTSTYRGNVLLSQGSIKITAALIIIHNTEDGVERIEMQGSETERASFHQLSEAGEKVTGLAKRIEYNSSESILTLTEDAELQQGNNFIKSKRIDYNTALNNLVAGTDGTTSAEPDKQSDSQENPDRVRIIITPKQKTSEK